MKMFFNSITILFLVVVYFNRGDATPVSLYKEMEPIKFAQVFNNLIKANPEKFVWTLQNCDYDLRMDIAQAYETLYHKSLKSEIDHLPNADGDLKDILKYMVVPRAEIYADAIKAALDGAGTDDKALVDNLGLLNNTEKHQVVAAYKRLNPGRNLWDDIDADTSFLFNRLVLGLLENDRDENEPIDASKIKEMARQLYDAGEGKFFGTDDDVFIEIFTKKSMPVLKAALNEYGKNYGLNMKYTANAEFSGDDYLGFLELVKIIEGKDAVLSEMLCDLINKPGLEVSHEQKKLRSMRIIVSRDGLDLNEIQEDYKLTCGSMSQDLKLFFTSQSFKVLEAVLERNSV